MNKETRSRIVGIGTAVPKYQYNQAELASWMHQQLDDQDDKLLRKLEVLYRKTKIEKRHSVLPDFEMGKEQARLFKQYTAPKVENRLAIYNEEVITLAEHAIKDCTDSFDGVTHFITVSCTGMSAPGIEIQLTQKLGLDSNVQCHAVNFVGCYAFFPALKMADAFCKSNKNAKVLVVAVELCTLHFQNKPTDDHMLSNSLFADGAASALVTSEQSNESGFRIVDTAQLLIPKGEKDMAWNIHSEGFLMKLSSYVPALVDEGLSQLIEKLFEGNDKRREEIKHWAIHPGGRRILEICEKELALEKHALNSSYEVLKKYGNMSAPTILFVLKEMLQTVDLKKGELIFTCGFGPGLTLESSLLEIV